MIYFDVNLMVVARAMVQNIFFNVQFNICCVLVAFFFTLPKDILRMDKIRFFYFKWVAAESKEKKNAFQIPFTVFGYDLWILGLFVLSSLAPLLALDAELKQKKNFLLHYIVFAHFRCIL